MDNTTTRIDVAPGASPVDAIDLDAEVAELAKLKPLEYDRLRESRAKELGVRVSTLDRAVEEKRNDDKEDTAGQGRPLEFKVPPLFAESLKGQGAEVLDAVLDTIRQHMHIQEHHAVIATLWAVHTHCWEAFPHTPRLIVTAPAENSGKTVLLYSIIGELVVKPFRVELLKAAAFFRVTEQYRPTWLIDEIDAFLREDSDLPAALNSGHSPDGNVARCVGDDHEVRAFSTYAPVGMAGINALKHIPRATQSRAFIITLERAVKDDIKVIFDRELHTANLETLASKIARWVSDDLEQINQGIKTVPIDAINRLRDNWRPLFAIAHAAGGNWPERVANAFRHEQEEETVDPTKPLQLLADIHRVILSHEKGMRSTDLIDRLCALDESPWAEYNFKARDDEHKRLQPEQLKAMLKSYKCERKSIRYGTGKSDTFLGYSVHDLNNAYTRYATPKQVITRSHVTEINNLSQKEVITSLQSVITKNEDKPLINKECDHVITPEWGIQRRDIPSGTYREVF